MNTKVLLGESAATLELDFDDYRDDSFHSEESKAEEVSKDDIIDESITIEG